MTETTAEEREALARRVVDDMDLDDLREYMVQHLIHDYTSDPEEYRTDLEAHCDA